jgi:hypothetical protein
MRSNLCPIAASKYYFAPAQSNYLKRTGKINDSC